MKSLSIWLIICLLIYPFCGKGQEPSDPARNADVFQARVIKINRMSESWRHEYVELRLLNGTNRSGTFLSIRDNQFQLQDGQRMQEVPLRDVDSIVLKRKPQDLFLVTLTAVGVAALFGGAATLGFDASQPELVGACAIGGSLGFFVGWRAFYQNTEIPLWR